MSTIVTSNVSDGTLSIPTTYVTNGSAKAWVNFNGTGTIAVGDSFNVASLVDNGVGDYRVNVTNSFANTSYASSGSFNWSANADQVFIVPSTASQIVVGTYESNSAVDRTNVQCITHGDLA